MDRYFWDGLVRGVGAIGQVFGTVTTSVDERGINAGVDETTAGARGLGRVMSTAHSGQIQTYLGAIAIGMLALLLLYNGWRDYHNCSSSSYWSACGVPVAAEERPSNRSDLQC